MRKTSTRCFIRGAQRRTHEPGPGRLRALPGAGFPSTQRLGNSAALRVVPACWLRFHRGGGFPHLVGPALATGTYTHMAGRPGRGRGRVDPMMPDMQVVITPDMQAMDHRVLCRVLVLAALTTCSDSDFLNTASTSPIYSNYETPPPYNILPPEPEHVPPVFPLAVSAPPLRVRKPQPLSLGFSGARWPSGFV